MCPCPRGAKDRHNEGGRSQRPPFFFFGTAPPFRVPDVVQRASAPSNPTFVHLHSVAKAAYLGRIFPKAA
jgi:hypothetical protein